MVNTRKDKAVVTEAVTKKPTECDYTALDHILAMLKWLGEGKNPFTGGVG